MDKSISVIVTAYNRKDFLLQALNSISKQTLKRGFFEVIVIKNFKDKIIDNYIKRKGFKSITTKKEISLGEMLYSAIKKSRGDIICFLDDDDIFYKNRLKHIKEIFEKNKDINYYHNQISFIDSDGKDIIGFKNIKRFNNPIKLSWYDYRVILYNIGFNSSSIAIKRDSIRIKRIKHIKANPDGFLLFSALSNKKFVFADSEVLTKYRIHSSNTSLKINKERQLWEINLLQSWKIIESMLNDPRLKEIETIYKLYAFYIQSMILHNVKRTKFVRYIKYVIKYEILTKRFSLSVNKPSILFTIYIISPKIARKLLYRYKVSSRVKAIEPNKNKLASKHKT